MVTLPAQVFVFCFLRVEKKPPQIFAAITWVKASERRGLTREGGCKHPEPSPQSCTFIYTGRNWKSQPICVRKPRRGSSGEGRQMRAALVNRAALYTNYYCTISNTWRRWNKSESRRSSKHPQVLLSSICCLHPLLTLSYSSKFCQRGQRKNRLLILILLILEGNLPFYPAGMQLLMSDGVDGFRTRTPPHPAGPDRMIPPWGLQ